MASRRLALGSLVRAKTKIEAERVGKYMLRPVLALERLTFLELDGKVDPMLCPKCGSFAVLMVCMSAVE